MLGWTLGGYPSPNLEVVAAVGQRRRRPSGRWKTWRGGGSAGRSRPRSCGLEAFSAAFREFPFHIGRLPAPMQFGPANLLWEAPTGYRATMVGFPYDDLDGWRAVYPADVFAAQLERLRMALRRVRALTEGRHR